MTRNSLIFMALRIAIGVVVALVCIRVFHFSNAASIVVGVLVTVVLRLIFTPRSSGR